MKVFSCRAWEMGLKGRGKSELGWRVRVMLGLRGEERIAWVMEAVLELVGRDITGVSGVS